MSNKLLNSVLKRNKVVSESAAKIEKKKAVPQKLKESEILFNEVNSLVESAARESLKNVILESTTLSADDKINSIGAVEKPLTESEVSYFIKSTIDPILETVGNINSGQMFKSNNKKMKGVNLVVYEAALTLEAAARGVLTMESLENKCMPDDPGPVREEVDTFVDQVDPGPIADEGGAAAKSPEEDAMSLADIVDTTVDPTYNFGDNLEENSVADLMDVHPNEDFDAQAGVSQDYRHEDEPDFNDAGAIEPYEGEEAGNPDNGLFDKPMIENYRRLSRYLTSLNEEFEGDTNVTTEVAPDFESDTDIAPYQGQEAGKPEYDAPADELSPDGTAEELAEQQEILAKTILNKIFMEYGVGENSMKRKIVKEAMHYLTKYGIDNLVPAYSDVAHLVTDQNRLAESATGPTAAAVIEATKPIVKKSHVRAIRENCDEIVKACVNAHALAGVGLYKEANMVKEAVITTLKGNELERKRMSFRHRISGFNETAKQYTLSTWVLVERNDPVASDIEKHLTVKAFITENADMVSHLKTLGSHNPLAFPEIKKRKLNVDSLTTAAIMTEAAMVWTKMKNQIYNGAPLEYKFVALESMIGTIKGYKNLCTAMYDNKKPLVVLESFEYRLKSLKDKVESRLNG